MKSFRVSFLGSLLFFHGFTYANGEKANSYLQDIKPVLKERCFACHGALKQKGKLRLDTVAAMEDGDVLGEDGELLARIVSKDTDEHMPPEGEPLHEHEIAAIKRWLADGAPAPPDEKPEADPKSHWAFQHIERPPGLSVGKDNPIDVYLASRHKAGKLVPQPMAERTILIRRLYLDLIGLPPTPDQLASKEPINTIIDDLLASPRYGERWGRHWMDIWRYSDWYGLGNEVRDSQKHLWRWRDWIVNSLNENKGYDQMIREMLAGDEIAPSDPKVIAATGFLARSYFKFNRTTWLDNTIEHTSKAFMGLTMNCAKCHDHKYDPIDHVDYYKFRAIFEPYQVRVDAVPGQLDLEKDGLARVYDGNLEAATYLHKRGEESKADKRRMIRPGPPSVLSAMWSPPKSIDLPKEAWHPDSRSFVQEAVLAKAWGKVTAAEAHLAKLKLKPASKKKELPLETQNKPIQEVAGTDQILVDNFSKSRPDLWELVGEDWRYQGGLLSLTKPSIDSSFLRSKKQHPEDFEVELRFRTTGGDRWKSVGVRFDVDESGNNSHWVYTSVGGNKVHLAHTVEGKDQYTNGMVSRPIKLNQEYTLNLKVRGSLINVALDGNFLFAFNLPRRNPGAIQLLAYDAIADFYRIEVRPLPAEVVLKEAREKAKLLAAKEVVTQEVIELAEAKLRFAQAGYAFKMAQVEADQTSDGNAIEMARRKQLEASLAQAKVDHLDPKKAAKAGKMIAKFEADLKAENLPEFQPISVSKVSLIKTPNKNALPSPGSYPKTSSGRRTALANWLTHRDHPLTARVAVNHLWLRHFGSPLVESVEDFGLRAPKPLHQDLLDFLAVELIESGWDMKHLHRLMVSSEAWQRSSSNRGADHATLASDPENREFWRMNSRRMESQVVRDSLLHLAGTLDLKQGGPPVMPSPDTKRRSLYFFHSRDGRSKFLETFDDADVFGCYRRSESIVPQQALAMMNSKTAAEAARKIAASFGKDLDNEKFIKAVFFKILGRKAYESELAESLTFLKQSSNREHFVHALINLNDFFVIR
ncbi:MAG: PSD1 and planctomycete cytochrome C domain-containing protein [Akkermansiaceae bacterium]